MVVELMVGVIGVLLGICIIFNTICVAIISYKCHHHKSECLLLSKTIMHDFFFNLLITFRDS